MSVDHSALGAVLGALHGKGVEALPDHRDAIRGYRRHLEAIDPDTLSAPEALAYWLNLYNAGALDLAAEAHMESTTSVLRVPGAFSRPWAGVAGSELSLDAIEHGKIRRFKDPRVHGALVCGSASCPTLRYEPYTGAGLDSQLDTQMTDFFANGGAVVHNEATGRTLYLSRILLWFGGDFVRPHRMPTFLPATKSRVAAAVAPWLDRRATQALADRTASLEFQPYDWSLACSVG